LSKPVVDDDSAILDDFDETLAVQVASPPSKSKAKVAAKATPEIKMPGHKGMRTMKILLEENPDIPPTGQFIGHNGVSYLLKAGMWCDVPMPIIEILNHAVMQVPDRDPTTNQIIGWREKLRYPYRVAPGSMAA